MLIARSFGVAYKKIRFYYKTQFWLDFIKDSVKKSIKILLARWFGVVYTIRFYNKTQLCLGFVKASLEENQEYWYLALKKDRFYYDKQIRWDFVKTASDKWMKDVGNNLS